MLEQLNQAVGQAKARYEAVKKSVGMLDAVRRELGSLRDKGDFISEDDVVRSAGSLVHEGLDPQAMAGLLADMPSNPQGMSDWVEHLWSTMSQREAMLMPQLAQARHAMGVAALQALAGHHIAGQLTGQGPSAMQQPQPQQQSNAMAPEGAMMGAPPNAS